MDNKTIEEKYMKEEFDLSDFEDNNSKHGLFYDEEAWAQRKSNTIDYGIPLYYGFFTIGTKDDMYKLRDLIKKKHLTLKDFTAISSAVVARTPQNTSRLEKCSDYNIDLDDKKFGINRSTANLIRLQNVMKKKNVTFDDIVLIFKTIQPNP